MREVGFQEGYLLRNSYITMGRSSSNYDFVGPMILKILKVSDIPLTTLAVSFMVNQGMGKIVNMNVIKNHLKFLTENNKISRKLDKGNGILYYKMIL